MTNRPFLDTQILVGALNGSHHRLLLDGAISSIVALELFGVQGKKPTQAAYYIPALAKAAAAPFEVIAPKRDHPFGKHRTDSIVMNFGRDFPAIVEYGNLAVASIINDRRIGLFEHTIAHLPKPRRKALRSKLELVLDAQLICVPLRRSTIRVAQTLLGAFVREHQVKKNFRNSWNDMLIAATAVDAEALFITEDSLLQRHIASQLGAALFLDSRTLEVDFTSGAAHLSSGNRESKGYINRNWSVHFRQNRAANAHRSA